MTLAAWIAVIALVLAIMAVGGWALAERVKRIAAERRATAIQASADEAANLRADAADRADTESIEARRSTVAAEDAAAENDTVAVASREARSLDGDADAQVEAIRRITGAGGAS